MSEDKELFDDDDTSMSEDGDDEFEVTRKDVSARRTDALRRIEEYRRIKELRSQVAFFDEEYGSIDDYLSDS